MLLLRNLLPRTVVYALLGAARVVHAGSTPIIDLSYARYQGEVDAATNITTFLGIRYAAAPTAGQLRFGAPQPPQNVPGVQQATAQPDQCFQAPMGTNSTNPLENRAVVVDSSEDCLFLSVSYPSDPAGVPAGLLPTIVYIHGGEYIIGASSQFRGSDIVNESNKGVVAVIIQYRLGLFGFLAGAAMKKKGALNAGLRDQEFALRWVNQHISKFGGDPSKVTIWGESAGAGSVLQHVVANGGRTTPQLFRGAITSSLFVPSQYNYDDRIPELVYSEVVAQSNCTGAADSIACLRAADVDALENANVNINGDAFFGTVALVPVVDGQFIAQRPTLSLAQGKINGKALLSVTNAFEGTIFVNSTEATANATRYALDLYPKFGPAQADRVGALYAGLGTQLFQTNAVYGESVLICPTYFLLRAFSGRGFKGEFAVPAGLHGRDLPYYFPSIGIDVPELDFPIFNNTDFVNAFAQSFTSFAISLDPNIKVDPTNITPKWRTWSVGNTEMLFNKTDADVPDVRPIQTDDALLQRCEFWNSVGGLTGQ
ncbi:Alpha/Beta hydrolase protein [Mycena rosella]|uniref:Carboxylic ester hydrolase n=1 Tax=Mycena rosella TaxID=1033263 RepID=A0AAD7E0Y6_MYCRO|nr:Alpha/Beta hydrolase protein [Mycena rosella]